MRSSDGLRWLPIAYGVGVLICFYLAAVNDARAHYDSDPNYGRHYYQVIHASCPDCDSAPDPQGATDSYENLNTFGNHVCDGPGWLGAHP